MEDPMLMARQDAFEEAARMVDRAAEEYEQLGNKKEQQMPGLGVPGEDAVKLRQQLLTDAKRVYETARVLRAQAYNIRNLK